MDKLISKAREICTAAHEGQIDKAGKPYHLHPERVAARCSTAAETIVALLHDTVEDTYVSPEYLRSQGFPQEIVDAVMSVTKTDGESYEDFVARAKKNVIGRQVKIHDLEDNMDVSRLNEITDETVARLRKYLAAYHFLKSDDMAPATHAQPMRPMKTKSQVWRERRAEINRRISSAGFYTGKSFNKERISIEMEDGSHIQERHTIDSFVRFLRVAGFAAVAELGIMHAGKHPLVCREPSGDYYRGPESGWYVLKKCPCVLTAQYINRIADELDMHIICSIVPK